MSTGGGRPTEEELAAVLAALGVQAVRTAADGPLAAWRRRRLAALGQLPRRLTEPRARPPG